MSIGVYLRVSSKSQRVDSQRREVQRYLDGNGITDARWFVDTMSGAKVDRPGLSELRKAVFDGNVRTMVLYRLDRLARSIRDGINVLTEWLDAGVRIVIVTMQVWKADTPRAGLTQEQLRIQQPYRMAILSTVGLVGTYIITRYVLVTCPRRPLAGRSVDAGVSWVLRALRNARSPCRA